MKKFFTSLFWRRNAKAGALMGWLLALGTQVVMISLALLAVYAKVEPPEFIGDMVPVLYWTVLGYAVVLHGCLLWDVLRSKTKNMKACWWMLAAVVLAAVCGVVYGFDTEHYTLFSCCVFASFFALTKAIDAVEPEKRVGWWKWIAPALVFAFFPLAELCIPVMSAKAEKSVASLAARHGVTWDGLVHAHTNGVPLEAHPYKILFTKEGELQGRIWDIRGKKNYAEPITDEEMERYNAFMATNAVLAELLEEMADKPRQKLTAKFEDYSDLFYTGNLSQLINWVRYFRIQASFAAHNNEPEAVMNAIRRSQNITDSARTLPFIINNIVWVAMESVRMASLSSAISIVPDEVLEKWSNELHAADDNIRDIYRIVCEEMVGYQKCADENRRKKINAATAILFGQFYKTRHLRYMSPCIYFKLHHSVWNLSQVAAKFFAAIKAPAVSDYQRWLGLHKQLSNDRFSFDLFFLDCAMYNLLPQIYQNHLVLKEQRNAASIAIAVERFRRAHGGLPETLDALVLEFLESVPDSIFQEGPFTYTRGEVCVTWEGQDGHPKFIKGFQIASKYKVPGQKRERSGADFTISLP